VAGIYPNTLLAVLAVAVLLFGVRLLWRPGEPPVLFFAFAMQWVQGSVKVFQANWMEVPVTVLPSYGGKVDLAIALSLFGVAFLALGMRLGAGPWHSQDGEALRTAALSYGPRYWFRIYVAVFVISNLASSLAYLVPGLSQPLLVLTDLKWGFFWILAYVTFCQGSNRQYWYLAFGIELLLSLGGYFSDFKTPLIFSALAVVAVRMRLSLGRYLLLFTLGAVMLLLAVAWTAIKVEYRDFASGGQQAQIVAVPYSQRMEKLAQLVSHLDGDEMAQGFTLLLWRLAYTDYLAVTLDNVPSALPHENGALWWDAIRRPFMPRMFFPEKSAINESAQVEHYTGIPLGLTSGGSTSISLGYMTESYIDFGAVGMMVPILGLGLLLGLFYRQMLKLHPPLKLVGIGLATATVYGAYLLETSTAKICGGLAVAMLVSWAILRVLERTHFLRAPSRVASR
jgi:hypothetical protein